MSSHNLFFRHAKSTHGRPSGGLALMIRKELLGSLVAKSDSFLAVEVSNVVIFVVYFLLITITICLRGSYLSHVHLLPS